MRFRKKPIEVDAWQWSEEGPPNLPAWIENGERIVTYSREAGGPKLRGRVFIETLEGTMAADFGDWIIKGVKGELYPCKPDIFEMTYEPVDTPTE